MPKRSHKLRQRRRAKRLLAKKLSETSGFDWVKEGSLKVRLLAEMSVLEDLLNECRWNKTYVTFYTGHCYQAEVVETSILQPILEKQYQRIISEFDEPDRRVERLTTDSIHIVDQTNSPPRSLRIQRAIKKKQANQAQHISRSPKRCDTEPKHDPEIALEFKERIPRRKGWYDEWRPTRDRYWCPVNNNWKQHGKFRKQWMKNL